MLSDLNIQSYVKKTNNAFTGNPITKKDVSRLHTKFKKAKVIDKKADGTEILGCQCSRVFVHDRKLDTYRRALNEEI